MIGKEQVPEDIYDIVKNQTEIFKEKVSITVYNEIPNTNNIPLENKTHWLQIQNVICVFVDMINSTQMSASTYSKSTASIYNYFTETAIRIFHEINAPYIDVKGDGVFALFNSNQVNKAVAGAVLFKTFIKEEFYPRIKSKYDLKIGNHCGIDQKTVLVKRFGLKRANNRTDRQNEVWAGKPINMAAKLASLSEKDEVLVSDRFWKNIKHEKLLNSCGCPNNEVVDLWTKIQLNDNKFDFDTCYKLENIWCKTHGKEFCNDVLK